MLDKSVGENGYVAAYWSAFDTIVQNKISKGIPRKEAVTRAKSQLAGHVKSYNPLKYSFNSVQGSIYIKQFIKSRDPEAAYLVRKTVDEYEKKIAEFWIRINEANKRGRFTDY